VREQADEGRSSKTWLRRLGAATGSFVIVLAAVLVLGAHAPAIPFAGAFGSFTLGLWPAYLLGALVAGAVIIWRSSRGAYRAVLLALASIALAGLCVASERLIASARANHVHLTGTEVFGRPNNFSRVPADEIVTYAHDLGDDLTVRIYRPLGPAPRSGWPILIYVHGGGWIGGSNAQRGADWRWFAGRGWIVLSVDYSLSNDRRHLWNHSTDQVKCAMAWANINLSARGGDMRRFALVGESAGGNLVLNAGYLASQPGARSICGPVPRPNAVIAEYPGVDLVSAFANSYPWIGIRVRRMVTSYIGGPPSRFPGRYSATASATYLHPAAPPTLLFMAENDHLVPIASLRAFESKARRTGGAVRTVIVPYAEHGFDSAGVGNAIFRQVTLQFLTQNVLGSR
jgi:acetyl esterase